jgi:phosphate uptake regulator
MVFEFFRGKGESQVETIEAQIGEMLATTRETFGMALDALTRRADPEEVGKPLRKADRSVNKVERRIRRELVVHAGVRGSEADIPLLLTYMSISKDIERIGDMTKDMWGLAAAGVDISASPYLDEILGHAEGISDLITETARVFSERDAESATRLLKEMDALKDRYEELMLAQLHSAGPTSEAVARALLYRHIHRIAAHLMNVMTAVVMPLDRLDYWDEDKVDRP